MSGHDVDIAMDSDIGSASRKTCDRDAEDESFIIANIVRKHIWERTCIFGGWFGQYCQAEYVPGLLITLINVVLYQPNITVFLPSDRKQIIETKYTVRATTVCVFWCRNVCHTTVSCIEFRSYPQDLTRFKKICRPS